MGQSLTRSANLPPPTQPPPAHANNKTYQLQQPAHSSAHLKDLQYPAHQQKVHRHPDSSRLVHSPQSRDPNLHNGLMNPNSDLLAGYSLGSINNDRTVLTLHTGTVTEYFPLGEPVTIQHYAQDQYDHPPSPDPYPLNLNMQGQVGFSTDDEISSDEAYDLASSVDSVHDFSVSPLDFPTDEEAASSEGDSEGLIPRLEGQSRDSGNST